jgi:hemerythrin-like domain-containing protein
MNVDFEYFSNDKTGMATLSFSKGMFDELQRKELIEEIDRQQTTLIFDKTGVFKPQSPITGLPQDIEFEYSYEQISPTSRSVKFKMSCEYQINQPIEEQIIEENNSSNVGEINQNDWVNLYLNSLDQHLNTLPVDSYDRAEKLAFDYVLTELKEFLNSHDEKTNTLLFFSAYLDVSATHFMNEDREKASLFLLAARLIEPKNQALRNYSSENKNMFAKIFQGFFSGK